MDDLKEPDVALLCPVEPHQMDKKMRRGFDDLVRRIIVSAVAHGCWSNDLFLRIYTAGIYHGMALTRATLSDNTRL